MLNVATDICFWFILIQYKNKKGFFLHLFILFIIFLLFLIFSFSYFSSSSSSMSASIYQPHVLSFLYKVLLSYCCQYSDQTYFMKFEVLMTVSIKIAVLWYVMSCSLVDEQQSFEGSCCLHHQGRRVSYLSMYLTNNMVSHPGRP